MSDEGRIGRRARRKFECELYADWKAPMTQVSAAASWSEITRSQVPWVMSLLIGFLSALHRIFEGQEMVLDFTSSSGTRRLQCRNNGNELIMSVVYCYRFYSRAARSYLAGCGRKAATRLTGAWRAWIIWLPSRSDSRSGAYTSRSASKCLNSTEAWRR